MRRAALALVALAAAASACGKNPYLAEIDGVTLPGADDVVPAEPGPTIVVAPETREEDLKLPTGPVVRIAADYAVSWRRVRNLARRLREQGSRPVLLVGKGITSEVVAWQPQQPLHDGKHLLLNATNDGVFYVKHPDIEQAIIVRGLERTHISSRFVREAVRDAVAGYRLHDIEVTIDPSMTWIDAVRAIDGARTCCTEPVRANLLP